MTEGKYWPLTATPVPNPRADREQLFAIDWEGRFRPGQRLTLFCARFDTAGFELRRFQNASIHCPDHIARAVKKRQAEFFFGRLCARAALSAWGFPDGVVGVGAMREPVWPAGMAGSISHTRTLACAAVLPVAGCRGIGIDLEVIADEAALAAIRATIVSEKELTYLTSLGGRLDMSVLLTLVFSAKESFFKGAFHLVRRYFDFDAIALEQVDLAAGTMSFSVAEPLCPQFMPGTRCTVEFALIDAEHVATVYLC